MTAPVLPLRRLIPALALGVALVAPAQLAAQGREVVQPLPAQASQELTRALERLARSPRDLDALIAAGTASLELGDVDAAMGFFGRAADLAPNDPRIKAGRAAALVRTERPIEALALFREAEEAGVEIVRLAGDYGLAHDLVGLNRDAQALYRRALGRGDDDEVTRRLALSLAIAGDERGFEEALRPLLARRDMGAYRARAFGLAILGKADDAIAITETVMPRDMARRLEDYLRFMPRLTRAQQAAAANLGIYPTAGRIGRDDPRIAALAGNEPAPAPTRTADASLAPRGAPLGSPPAAERASPARTSAATNPESRGRISARSREEARQRVQEARREVASDPLSRTRRRPRIVERAAPPPTEEPAQPTVLETRTATQQVVAAQTPPAAAAATPAASPMPAAPVSGELPPVSAPVVVATIQSTPTVGPVDEAGPVTARPAPPAAPPPPPPPPPAPAPSVADAFADLSPPAASIPAGPPDGAVDISTIEAPREVERKPEPPAPPTPVHPSRFWVQVATGRDREALRFDWRRISRQAEGLLEGKGPFVTPWGQANRLLAGPYDSRQAARNALNSLSEKGIDAFGFTSPEGQEIVPLG